MPVAALLDEKILCMHGGLSTEMEKVEQIKKIVRPTDVPEQGLLCDLLWSDPDDGATDGFGENDRGVSVIFNGDIVKKFLKNNDLDLIVRAHQVFEEENFLLINNWLQYLALPIIVENLIMLVQ